MREGYIRLTLRVYKEGKQYVARCEELGISTCARSIDGAFRRIEDATTLYLNSIEEEGERVRVFKELGIEIRPGEPTHELAPVSARPDEDIVKLHDARVPALAFS